MRPTEAVLADADAVAAALLAGEDSLSDDEFAALDRVTEEMQDVERCSDWREWQRCWRELNRATLHRNRTTVRCAALREVETRRADHCALVTQIVGAT